MQGIQSLMPGQAQQAPMPGMMPKPGASTPPAVVAGLERLPSQQLLQMYSQKPSLQILAALDKAYKREELDQSMRGQQAMQAAQPGTVADQVVSQISNRGIAQFSGGGAVAFGGGGAVQHFTKGSDENGVQSSPATRWLSGLMGTVKEAFTRDPEAEQLRQKIRNQFAFAGAPAGVFKQQTDEERQRAKEIMRLLPTLDKEQMRNILGQTQRTVDPAAYQEFGPGERMEQMTPPVSVPSGTSMAAERPRAASPGAEDRAKPGPGAGNRPVVAAATPAVPTQGLQNLVDLDKAQKEELAVIQGRQAVDPTVLAARKAEREGAEGIATGRQTRSQAQLTEAQRLRDEALQRSQGDIFSDPEALLRIASGIDTRKGRGIGSLAGGVADIMGQRRSEAAAARKDFQTAQNLHNQELNALDTLRQLQRERDTAIAAGDVTAARAIQDQITSVNRFYQKAKEDRQTAERNYQLDVLKTQATQDQARAAMISAGRPSELEQRSRLFKENPEQYRTMYGIDPKETSVELRALKDEEQSRLKELETAITDAQRKPIQEKLEEIRKMRRTLMGATPTPATSTQLPPAALSQLKEGVATTFANGQQWTLKNGQPTQVK